MQGPLMKVFISHALADRGLARKAAEVLTEAGLEVFWDAQVLPGDNWAEAHARALESAQAMLVLLSPASIQSAQVRADLSFALGRQPYKDRVVPVLISSYDLLEYSDVPWVLKRMELVKLDDFDNESEAFRQIAVRLKESMETANG